MSFEITTAFVQQFKDNAFHLAQQKGSRLRRAVFTEIVTGKSAFFERIGLVTAQPKTSRHSDTPIISTPHSRRRVDLNDFIFADLIDKLDKVRLLINPESEYAIAGFNALGRAIDDTVITAFTGDARGGEDGSTLIPLPAAQIIVDGGTGLTIDKLRESKQKLDSADVDPDEPRFFVTNAIGIEDLLKTTEVTSSDFNTVKALAMGQVNSFLGFDFIRSERLEFITSSTTVRKNVAFTMRGMGLAIGQDVMTRITERPDKNHATQVFLDMAIGATRVEEVKVIEVDVDESV